MNRQRLEQLARLWQRQLALRDVLFALAVANAFLALTAWQTTLSHWELPILALAATLLLRLAVSRPWRLTALRLSHHLDRTVSAFEESGALFLRSPEQLTLLERLQSQRVNRALTACDSTAEPVGAPPRDFLQTASLCLAAAALLAGISGLLRLLHPSPAAPVSSWLDRSNHAVAASIQASAPPLPKIFGNIFTVAPPAYTGHAPRQVAGFTAGVEEGAAVTWDIAIDRPTRDVRLVSGSTTFPLAAAPDYHLRATRTVAESALFSLAATLPDGTPWNPPELFSVKVIKDQPPAIRLLQPTATRTEIIPPVTAPVIVEATISDDYAVAEAHLVATVAKGSGEAVKFREQALPFDTNTAEPAAPLVHRFTKSLDLTDLGMEPGDELYFYVEAHDNRQPAANRTRSETRFLTLRGPDEKKTTTGRGVAGVNLIPAYFRSERQLIIDTEKTPRRPPHPARRADPLPLQRPWRGPGFLAPTVRAFPRRGSGGKPPHRSPGNQHRPAPGPRSDSRCRSARGGEHRPAFRAGARRAGPRRRWRRGQLALPPATLRRPALPRPGPSALRGLPR